VADSLDIMARHPDRVKISLSVTAPASREDVIKILEPNASSISERLQVLEEAHSRGVRTYGMLCPCLPGIADSPDALEEMFGAIMECNPEDIWLEPINPRGKGLIRCAEALAEAGFHKEAKAVNAIRSRKRWNEYAVNLVKNAQKVAAEYNVLDRLHMLLYSKPFDERILSKVMEDKRGIVLL